MMAVEMMPTRPSRVTASPEKLYIIGVMLSIPAKFIIRRERSLIALREEKRTYVRVGCTHIGMGSVIKGW